MKNIFNQKFLLAAVISLGIISIPYIAYGAIVTNTNPESLDDAVQLLVNVAQWILGIVGSLALLMFVIGGFMFLISAGNSKTVETGKNILIGAVIGLIIVFCSYMIIKFSMSALGLRWSGYTTKPTVIVPDKCDSLSDQGYDCMDSAEGKNCKSMYCKSFTENNIQCCQPK